MRSRVIRVTSAALFALAINGVLLVSLAALSRLDARLDEHRQDDAGTTVAVHEPQREPPPRERTRRPPRLETVAPPALPPLAGLGGVPVPDLGVYQDLGADPALRSADRPIVTAAGTMDLTAEMVDEPPRVLVRFPLHYPPDAEQRGIEGAVTVRMLVGRDGEVRQVTVLESTPAGVFDAAAVEALQRWRFTPAQLAGETVRVWVRERVRFELR